MILALFGTNPYAFERLVGFLERLAQERGHEIVAQTGTSRTPEGCRSFAYSSYGEIQNLMAEADVVVAQGGYGGCLDALGLGRPLVLVPRLREFGECLDDQAELASHLTAIGRTQSVKTYKELCTAIDLAIESSPTKSEEQGQPLGKAVAQAILDHLKQ